MNDEELIAKLKITSKDRVLDIGGSLKQHDEIRIDTLVDLHHPEKAPYWPSKLKARHFIQLDIARQKLPFADKEFDVCLCTHTLEDLYNPFQIMDEMSRVAKRGYLATPSRGKDMEFSHFNLTDWKTGARRQPGLSHHHWFFECQNKKLVVTPKIYPILYTSEFYITQWSGETECQYLWQDKISYEVFPSVDTHGIIKEYRDFIQSHRDKIQKGPVLFYLDNPIYILKECLKSWLQR
ncbi:methyltransferase domain-containing protein [Candidatus Microgenomates bacterium]|nr:methyltransferase domain-containing protein [Candidatus Microgenomates bacterium]